MHTHTGTNSGSVLIVTIIITAVILSIGITFAAIFQKEVIRQIYARKSQEAMNIANSALECTLFNDFRRSVFRSAKLADRLYDTVDCGGLYLVRSEAAEADWSTDYIPSSGDGKKDGGGGGPLGTGFYSFIVIDSEGRDTSNREVPCAHIAVKKECRGKDLPTGVCEEGLIETSIEVKGYSECSEGEAEGKRGLVRRFKVHY